MFPDRFDHFFPKTEVKVDVPVISEPKLAKCFEQPIILHQFRPAWHIQAYMRFSGISLHVENSRYVEFAATGELPQLSDGNYLVKSDEIIEHLQEHHIDIDQNLNDREKAESFAFRKMISGALNRSLSYSRWVDKTNYKEVTKVEVAKILPFPLNTFRPAQIRNAVRAKFGQEGMILKEEVYSLARDCYIALNNRLGDTNVYFYGDKPTSLDAVAFGHIIDALHDIHLASVLRAHAPNLIHFAERIRDEYFSSSSISKDSKTELYTTNSENMFTQLQNAFISKDSFQVDETIINIPPYRGRISASSTKKVNPKSEKDPKTELTPTELEEIRFKRRSRHVLIGAGVVVALYVMSWFSMMVVNEMDEADFDLDDSEIS